MIIYFANRKMKILGHATTNLPKGYVIKEDLKTEEVDTGVASFECKIGFNKENRIELEEMTNAGNYLLRSNDGENEFYTIIDSEIDTKDQSIYIYAEDAGLDLLNEVVGAYEATEAHTAEWYINLFTADSGFEIGINEISSSSSRKLSWDGEATATERVASVATQFGGFEVSYSFAIKGMEITHKYINIYEKRGKDVGEQLRLNRDIDRIITKKSVANLATAFLCEGGTPDESETPITLSGYSYDDGDFYVDGKYLKSRKAVAKWSRYQWEKNGITSDGHIVKQYSYDTTSQQTLCAHAVTELKKVCDMEVNYEIDINRLPDNIKIGDRVNIVDDAGQLYLSTRILLLETSVVGEKQSATLGEYLIKTSGISQKVTELAEQFAKNSVSAKKALEVATIAKTSAEEAKIQAEEAKAEVETATTKAQEAKTAADEVAESVAIATQKAETAQASVEEVKTSVSGLEASIKNAEEAAVQAQEAAEIAQTKVTEAQTAAANAQTNATEAKNAVYEATEKAEEAITKADSVYDTAELAKAKAEEAVVTATAAKMDAQTAEAEIEALGEDITTLERTMTVDYLRKTDLTEATANLQSQITQNATDIATTVSKYQMIDETVNDALDKATQAQEYATASQTQAEQALAEAESAQAEADNAKNAYEQAQTEADTAQASADTARQVADEAEVALTKAQEDLETISSRADATEEEIQVAQQQVSVAQEALNVANANLEEAIELATEAQEIANTARTSAEEAQTVANNAYSMANIAQMLAEQASEYAESEQTKADNALTQAEQAKLNAEEALATATEAQATADEAKLDAEEAQATADTAAQTAVEAQEVANEAQEVLTKAQTELTEAQARLETVLGNVDATEEEVAEAQTAVATAQTAADEAQEYATEAQAQADLAKADADEAQIQAEEAKKAADIAQAKANEARDDAEEAQAIVDGLEVRVENAETLINQNADEIVLRATKEEVSQSIGSAEERIKQSESEIKQLAEQISSLVRGEGGESLMIQTENGWTFDMTKILETINSTSDNVKVLNTDLENAQDAIETLDKSVEELGRYTNYIKFEPYNGQPCITLGQEGLEDGSDFKVLITNTAILFMEGSSVPASISNQALNIEKAVVDELIMEHEQVNGNFVWVMRANGNLGLVWKEGEE